MDRQNQKKSNRTKKAFHTAFLVLYKKNCIENISIQQLAESAGFSRATFYAYYDSIYDLLEEIEQDFLKELKPYFSLDNQNPINDGNPYPDMVVWFDYFKKNIDDATVLLNKDLSFLNKLSNRLRSDIDLLMKADGCPNDYPREYMLEYMVEGTIKILRNWLGQEATISPEKMAYNSNLLRKKWWDSRTSLNQNYTRG